MRVIAILCVLTLMSCGVEGDPLPPDGATQKVIDVGVATTITDGGI